MFHHAAGKSFISPRKTFWWPWLFVTFSIYLLHTFWKNFRVIPTLVQKLWPYSQTTSIKSLTNPYKMTKTYNYNNFWNINGIAFKFWLKQGFSKTFWKIWKQFQKMTWCHFWWRHRFFWKIPIFGLNQY